MVEYQNVIDWWNDNIFSLSISISSIWENLHIIVERSFFDLITEIIAELLLNTLSHGLLGEPVCIEFGQADEYKGKPRWAYLMVRNTIGERYEGGRQIGILTLQETISLINNGKRSIETRIENNDYSTKVWLLSGLLKTKE